MLRDFSYATNTDEYYDIIKKTLSMYCKTPSPYLYFLLIYLNSTFSYFISVLQNKLLCPIQMNLEQSGTVQFYPCLPAVAVDDDGL